MLRGSSFPARGGSKGLPGKNIKPLLGKPLIAWIIEQALASKYLDEVVVSTDDKEIAEISKKYGAEAPFMRPKELASDKAQGIDVALHEIDWLKKNDKRKQCDLLMLLQPTSPFRSTEDIHKAVELLLFYQDYTTKGKNVGVIKEVYESASIGNKRKNSALI